MGTTAAPDNVTTTTAPDNVTTTAAPKPPSPSPSPSPSPAHKGACRAAVGELKPFLNIFKDGPSGVYKNLKKNILDGDDLMVEYMEDVSKYCTFRRADAGKCGNALGSIVRVTLVGVESEILV